MIKMTYDDLLTDVAPAIFHSAAVMAVKMSQKRRKRLLENTDDADQREEERK